MANNKCLQQESSEQDSHWKGMERELKVLQF